MIILGTQLSLEKPGPERECLFAQSHGESVLKCLDAIGDDRFR